ncbi:MAG: TonB-dependent receptor [Pyrinomonadaceae bacterium]
MNRLKYFLLIVFISISSAVFAAAQTASFSGNVTYGGDNTPLHDASVKIVQLKQTTVTDDAGNFRFENIPAGRYTIIVHNEGFADASKIVDVPASGAATANFKLQISSLKAEVTVTASGTEQSVFDSFQTVNSIGSTRIMEKASTSLGEVLESETGVAKRSFGPGSSRPVIRGFDGDRVLVLQDGTRSGSVGSQSGDHGETVDPLSAERIEIVKGPATLLYGSNAIGGVVNVIGNDENEKHDGFRGNLTTIGGSVDRQIGFSGGLEYGVKNWLFRGNSSWQRTGDYNTPLGRIPNSASRSTAQSFSIGYYGKQAWISGNYGFDLRRYGVPFAAIFEGGGGEKPFGELPVVDEEIDLRQRENNFRIRGGFRNFENPFLSSVQYNLDYTVYRHKEIEIFEGIDEVGTIFDNKTFSYRSLFEQNRFGKLTGRFGVEGFSRDYQVNGAEQLIDGKIKQNSFSVFGLEELGFERVKFQFGGRLESNRYAAENPIYTDRNFLGFSGAFGVNFSLWKGGAFIVNYTNSYRAPALEELYNNGPHIGNVTFEIGNQNLERERANGVDFSLRHQSDRFKITGDVYFYRINNFVYFAYQDEDEDGTIDIEDGLPVARYEQANATYFGAELSGEYNFNKFLTGIVSLDTVRAKLSELDINLPRIPPARARLGLDFHYNALSVRPEVILTARQDKTFPLETETAGYGLFNIAASYVLGNSHTAHIFSVNATNLTDKLYRNHLSFIKDLAPEPGRGIRFGYTFRFF